MKASFNQDPQSIVRAGDRSIPSFSTEVTGRNIDDSVVKSFGEEWQKFYKFTDKELDEIGMEYFDILNEKIVNKSSYCIDIGCGTGRWSKYLCKKAGFIECIDPSNAILIADKVLKGVDNVRLSMASTDNIPFADETFDFGMSIGVLHHIPDTPRALADCVKKIKLGGYFYVYFYYALDNRGWLFRAIFILTNFLRKIISSLPSVPKKIACDIAAILIYVPVVAGGKLLNRAGLKKLAAKMPLNGYHKRSFFVIRNDALDRFGTKLEHRYSRKQVIAMMEKAGLEEIVVSEFFPYWHAVGKRMR